LFALGGKAGKTMGNSDASPERLVIDMGVRSGVLKFRRARIVNYAMELATCKLAGAWWLILRLGPRRAPPALFAVQAEGALWQPLGGAFIWHWPVGL
jgi:hypothetical protein